MRKGSIDIERLVLRNCRSIF